MIEPDNTVALLPTNADEVAGCENVADLLHHKHIPRTVRVGVERISQGGRGIESGEAKARLSADDGEIAAHQNPAVRLHCDRTDARETKEVAGLRVERISRAGRGIEPCDAVAQLSADGEE